MRTFALVAILSLAAAPALAQPTAPAPKAAAAVPAGIDQRIAQMHQRLKITAAQEPAWDAFAQVMRSNVATTDQAYKARAASISTMSAPDNMRNFAQIEQARAQDVQNLAAAFQTLYDQLSDEQKKAADTMFRHYQDHAAGSRQAAKG